MKQHTIAPLPLILTIVTLIALAAQCEAQERNNSSYNVDGEEINADCDITCQKWHVFQIKLFLVELPCFVLFSFVFASYVSIWREQRLPGWIVLAITGSLALRFGLNFLTNLPIFYFDWNFKSDLQEICLAFGVLQHLSYFMCYCWSLVQAFDLWRRVRTVTQVTTADNETGRFVAYCAFGFGVPFFNVVLAVILEWGVSDSAGIWKPSYDERCRVRGNSYNYYIGIPNGILIAANLSLLAAAFYFLWKAKKETGVAGGGGAIQKNLTGLIVKIFVLMGGLTITDFLLQYTGIYELNPYLNLPIELSCRVGHALGFVWVFVFTGNAKPQLKSKYPESFGKVFDALEQNECGLQRGYRTPVELTTTSADLNGSKVTGV